MLLQETHITSQVQADELNAEWNRICGLAEHRQTTFRGIASAEAAGVAILINPMTVATATAHRPYTWTDRRMVIELNNIALANVYAPNNRSDCERFFREVGAVYTRRADRLILGGDFNSVQNTRRDRLSLEVGKPRGGPNL